MDINRLFSRRRVLGDSLGALRHGVLGQLTGQDQPHRGLDLPGGDGGLLVVGSELGGLGRNTLEDVWGHASEQDKQDAFSGETYH